MLDNTVKLKIVDKHIENVIFNLKTSEEQLLNEESKSNKDQTVIDEISIFRQNLSLSLEALINEKKVLTDQIKMV